VGLSPASMPAPDTTAAAGRTASGAVDRAGSTGDDRFLVALGAALQAAFGASKGAPATGHRAPRVRADRLTGGRQPLRGVPSDAAPAEARSAKGYRESFRAAGPAEAPRQPRRAPTTVANSSGAVVKPQLPGASPAESPPGGRVTGPSSPHAPTAEAAPTSPPAPAMRPGGPVQPSAGPVQPIRATSSPPAPGPQAPVPAGRAFSTPQGRTEPAAGAQAEPQTPPPRPETPPAAAVNRPRAPVDATESAAPEQWDGAAAQVTASAAEPAIGEGRAERSAPRARATGTPSGPVQGPAPSARRRGPGPLDSPATASQSNEIQPDKADAVDRGPAQSRTTRAGARVPNPSEASGAQEPAAEGRAGAKQIPAPTDGAEVPNTTAVRPRARSGAEPAPAVPPAVETTSGDASRLVVAEPAAAGAAPGEMELPDGEEGRHPRRGAEPTLAEAIPRTAAAPADAPPPKRAEPDAARPEGGRFGVPRPAKQAAPSSAPAPKTTRAPSAHSIRVPSAAGRPVGTGGQQDSVPCTPGSERSVSGPAPRPDLQRPAGSGGEGPGHSGTGRRGGQDPQAAGPMPARDSASPAVATLQQGAGQAAEAAQSASTSTRRVRRAAGSRIEKAPVEPLRAAESLPGGVPGRQRLVERIAANGAEQNARASLGQAIDRARPELVRAAQYIRSGGSTEVRLQLEPPELGRMKVEIQMKEEITEVRIGVENAEVREAMRSELPGLERLFREAQVEVGRFVVGDYTPEHGGQGAAGTREHGWSAGEGPGTPAEAGASEGNRETGWVRISESGHMDCLV